MTVDSSLILFLILCVLCPPLGIVLALGYVVFLLLAWMFD